MGLINTQGKQAKQVPILLTKEMSAQVEMLMKHRTSSGISLSNKYVFANSSEGPITCNHVLTKMKTLARLEKPAALSATGMRKYIATTMQVDNLSVCKLQLLIAYLKLK